MKQFFIRGVLVIMIVCGAMVTQLQAGVLPPPPPGGDGNGNSTDPGVPIDGGISVLLIAGAGYAYGRVKRLNNREHKKTGL